MANIMYFDNIRLIKRFKKSLKIAKR